MSPPPRTLIEGFSIGVMLIGRYGIFIYIWNMITFDLLSSDEVHPSAIAKDTANCYVSRLLGTVLWDSPLCKCLYFNSS